VCILDIFLRTIFLEKIDFLKKNLIKVTFLDLGDRYSKTDSWNGFPVPKLVENEYKHGSCI